MDAVTIRPLRVDEYDAYFAYLADQLADNGANGMPMFMPMPRAESVVSPEREAAFRAALAKPFGEPGWRMAWIAVAADGRIAGHIDLRANPDRHAAHRCSLGMGTNRDFRFQGLGGRLVEVAETWARQDTALDWIDLDVLSSNLPGLALYKRCGYTPIGEVADMFHLDGQSYGYTLMTKRLLR